MNTIFVVLVNILVFIINIEYIIIEYVAAATTFESCRTPGPENEIGWCVPTAQCKILDDIKDLPLELFDFKYQSFITNSKCSDKSEEHFCCILDHINNEFASINGLANIANPLVQRLDNVTLEPSSNLIIPRLPNVIREDISNIDTHPNLKLLPDECGSTKQQKRVARGKPTGIREFPFMALLHYDRNMPTFRCGGTLINEKYVLTAAHCVVSGLFSVRLGEYNTKIEADCIPNKEKEDGLDCNDPVQDIPIESVTIHARFDKFQALHDIALLRLARPVNMTTNNVNAICLPVNTALRNTNKKIGLLTGWGATENGPSSDVLLKAIIYINSERKTCEDFYYKTYGVNVTDRLICAMGKKQEDSCQGDSGGPLFELAQIKTDEPKKYLQFGIVTSGSQIDCGNSTENGGSLYINVAKYMKFILDNIKP